MSKPVLGLTVGAILGFLDGASAWFSPEARPLMVTIVVGSTLKGLATGSSPVWSLAGVNPRPSGLEPGSLLASF